MATVKFNISKRGGDRPEVILLLTINNAKKLQCKVQGVQLYRKYWDSKRQQHNTTRKFIKPWEEEEIKELNKTLSLLSTHVLNKAAFIQQDLLTKEWLSTEIDNILHPEKNAPKEEKPKTLKEALAIFISNAPKKILKSGKPIGEKTITQYKNTQKRLTEYLRVIHRSDMEICEVDKDFYDSFIKYLYDEGYKLNTVGKHIKNLKAVINSLPMAQRVTCEFVEPKKCVKLSEEIDNIYLTEEELNTMATIEISTPYLDRVRDQFIMLAWTGCRYSDLPKLTMENIHKTSNGYDCFKLEQQKTKTTVMIPILPAVKSLLMKYNYNLPKPMANQKFNEYVKKVAMMAGLNDDVTITHTQKLDVRTKKRAKQNENTAFAQRVTQHFKKWECVTAHTARRSFATNMYKRNFPTLMIMAITGHKTEKAFLTYIKVSEEENAERMMEQFMKQEAKMAAQNKI